MNFKSGVFSSKIIRSIYPSPLPPSPPRKTEYLQKIINNNILQYFDCFTGYVVQGSNGEYAFMRPEEKIELVRKVRELAPKDKLVVAGSGCEGKKTRKRHIQRELLSTFFLFLAGGNDGSRC